MGKNAKTLTRSQSAIEKEKYLKEMEPLLSVKVIKKIDNSKSIKIGFIKKGNKHLYSDTFGRTEGLQKSDLKNLDKALDKAVFVRSAVLSKGRKDGISKFYYFKDENKKLYYNVAERRRKRTDGSEEIYRFLYSVTATIK